MKNISMLYADDPDKIKRLSSITQHRDKFSVHAQGSWLPISYDVIDSIICDKVNSHRAILSLDPHNIGYIFPTATCEKTFKTLLLTDKYGVVTEELPEWFGSGLYQKFVDDYAVTEGDNHPLGLNNTVRYKLGLEYYLAKETIEGED